MIAYIPAPAASAISDALWSLSRPPAVRESKDTQYLFSWVTALDDTLWLMVDTEYSITVHAEAVLGGIADILQPFIDAQQIPADTNTQLGAYIQANHGKVITVYDAFPQFFKDLAKTREQMIQENHLANPTLP